MMNQWETSYGYELGKPDWGWKMLGSKTYEPGDEVVLHDLRRAPDAAGLLDAEDHCRNTKVRHHDTAPLLLGKEDRVRVEVVGPCRIVLLARDVEEKVSRERKEFLTEKPKNVTIRIPISFG
jgi:hypothetical protein